MYKRYVFLQYIENAGRSRKYSNHLGAIFFFLTGITMSSQLESYSHKSDPVKTGLLECSLSACQIYRPLNYLSTQSLCRNYPSGNSSHTLDYAFLTTTLLCVARLTTSTATTN